MNTQFLQSDKGNFSSARLVFVVGILWSMIVSTLMVFLMKWTAGEFIAVFTATSGVFIALKLGQKPMEK
jgi:hypothetical protein